MKKIIIAIDGHSSCGKSTIAKALATHFNYIYIDTGAMYRAVALLAMRNNWISNEKVNQADLIKELDKVKIRFNQDSETFLNGENVEEEIRGVEVSAQVTKISQIHAVREILIREQREMGKNKGVVMDGRDIGTVVFPNAELKLYVTADIDIRAKRRYDQMIGRGKNVTLKEVKDNLVNRDNDDMNKGDKPLKKAIDAKVIDTSYLTLEQQFKLAVNYVEEAL